MRPHWVSFQPCKADLVVDREGEVERLDRYLLKNFRVSSYNQRCGLRVVTSREDCVGWSFSFFSYSVTFYMQVQGFSRRTISNSPKMMLNNPKMRNFSIQPKPEETRADPSRMSCIMSWLTSASSQIHVIPSS